MPTDLECALNNIIEVFHRYSLVKGNYHSLEKDDFKKLLENECRSFTKQKSVEEWFKELDINSDDAINFEEFLIMLVKMSVEAHKDTHKEENNS
ncbi:protein S100-A8 [Choloepus didactylus]|uniref:protein S100-A8 n=1 Tax=Choloepus didactylus TaxID=27675 RepID=UPI0018A00F72|nr:protein S100-A8 [Choloepus didactylus]